MVQRRQRSLFEGLVPDGLELWPDLKSGLRKGRIQRRLMELGRDRLDDGVAASMHAPVTRRNTDSSANGALFPHPAGPAPRA